MLNNEFLQVLRNRISGLFPMASSARSELDGRIQHLLKSSFSRLNLVTREEYDAQLKVLERAEAAIRELEEKVAAMEQQQASSPMENNENQ